MPVVIGIEKGNPFTSGDLDPSIAALTGPSSGLVPQNVDFRMVTLERLRNIERTIRRSIIDDDDFEFTPSLP
jgi:hypothetical protein